MTFLADAIMPLVEATSTTDTMTNINITLNGIPWWGWLAIASLVLGWFQRD